MLSWNLENDPDVCADWEGVFCRKADSSVVGLELNGFLLNSFIDADVDAAAVAGLPDLAFIDLANNAIAGDVSAFGSVPALKYIDVSGNSFSGPITPICTLPQIEIVIVSANEDISGDLTGCQEDSLSLVSAFGTGLTDCGWNSPSRADPQRRRPRRGILRR